MRNISILCALLVASPAVAQDAAAPPAPDKKICKTIVPTGSIMGKRICLTKSEWRQFDEINARTVDDVTGRSRMSAPKGGGDL